MSRRHIRLTPTRRHVAAIITIALSTAFVAVMVIGGALLSTALNGSTDAQLRGADLEIRQDEPTGNPPGIDGVRAIWPADPTYLPVGEHGDFLQFDPLPPASVAPTPLAEGRPAEAADEIVLEKGAAQQLDVGVGERITIPSPTGKGPDRALVVTGIADPVDHSLLPMGQPRAFLTEQNARTVLGTSLADWTTTWHAAVEPGTDVDALARSAGTEKTTVRSIDEVRQELSEQNQGGFTGLGVLIGAFVLIALVTSAVVVANTFTVTLAQRTRSLALLRTLGATRHQVRSTVLRESLLVGGTGSVIGMVGGHVLVQLVLWGAAAVGWLPYASAVPITVTSVLLPLVSGVLITLAAGIAPMRRATRVTPLEALRPAEVSTRRGPGLRGILAGIATALGLVMLVGGVLLSRSGSLGLGVLLAMAGGALSFVGILVGLVVATRPLTRLVGAVIAPLGGLPGRIAVANTRRHPGRSAATVAALLIGTTLMTMMAVGAHTADVSLTRDLANRKPVDVVVRAENLPAKATSAVADVDGIRAAETVPTTELDVGAKDTMTVYGATTAQLDATSVRADLGDEVADGVLLTGTERAEQFGLSDGQRITVPGADGDEVSLTVRTDGNLQMSLVSPSTMQQLAGPDPSTAIFARLAEKGSPDRGDADAFGVVDDIQQALQSSGVDEVEISAEGTEREMYSSVLNVLLSITLGLLAVAVLVALVGVANTLSLGVVERTGENALLRALGTTRRQMRSMLAWEGVLLALIGAVLGIVLGSVYGVAGVVAVLGSEFPVTLTVPWIQIAAVLVLALASGWVASVLPARRAARTAPAQALAAAE